MPDEEKTKEQLIAEHRETAESLRKMERELSLLVDTIPAMVFKGYADWSVDFYSDRVREITGYTKADFDSRRLKWRDVLLEEEIERAQKIFLKALKTNRDYVREYRIRRKDGEIIWIEERSRIVCDPNGRVEYVIGLFSDISGPVLTEKSSIKYREILQEMLMERILELKRANKRLRQAGLFEESKPTESKPPEHAGEP